MTEGDPKLRTLTSAVARHLRTAAEDLRLRRVPTGKFNTNYFVKGGPIPFYLLYEVQKYIVIRRVRNNDPERADAYRLQSLRLAEGLG